VVSGSAAQFLTKTFYDKLKEGKLIGCRCKKCNFVMIPPRLLCKECGSKDLELVEFKGTGTLETFTVIHVPPMRLKNVAPYVTGIVKLDEGPMIMGRIVGVDPNKPEELRMGQRMQMEVIEEDGKPVLAFKPVS